VDVSPPTELVWTRTAGGEACIDGSQVADRVGSTLGHRVSLERHTHAGPGAPADRGEGDAVIVQGQVGPDTAGRGWLAVVQVHRPGMPPLRRELAVDAPDCHQLDEAIVLVVALLVDAVSPTAPALIVSARAPTSVSIGPDLALAFGLLPGTSVGFGLASDVRIGSLWPIDLWAHTWPVSDAIANGSGGSLGAWTFGVGLGPAFAQGPWELFGVVGASAGEVYSNGVGLSTALSHTRAYAQAELRVGARARLVGPLLLRLDAGFGAPLARDRYEYTQADGSTLLVFETAPVIPLLRFGVEIRAP